MRLQEVTKTGSFCTFLDKETICDELTEQRDLDLG